MKLIRKTALIFLIICTFSCNVFANGYYVATNYTEKQKALKDLTVLSLNSNVMLVNGATRYTDESDLSLSPRLVDSKTYVPLYAAETIFNAYCVSDEKNADITFRTANYSDSDTRFSIDKGSVSINGVTQSKNEYLTYIDGKAYMPLRKLGELLGYSVVYDKGYILLGTQSDIDALTGNSNYYSSVKETLDSHTPVTSENVIYVSASATSSGNGSYSSPYKTISKAAKSAKPGDTVYIKGGIYRETLKPANSGTASAPITYKAADGEKVVISALEEVTGFTADESNTNIVSASVKYDLGEGNNQVFINDAAVPEARYPNINGDDYKYSGSISGTRGTDVSPLYPTKGDLHVSASDKYKVTSTTLLQDDVTDRWKGARFVSLHGDGWNVSTAKVAGSSKGSLTLDSDSVTEYWWYEPESSQTSFGYLTGTKEAIDQPGEWVMENKTLTMYLPEGKTAQSLTVEVKAAQLCIDLTGKSYINIEGIDTIGGGVTLHKSEMCNLLDCEMKYVSHYGLSNDQREGYIDETDLTSRNSEGAPQRGEIGVYIGGKNNVVRNCVIDTSAGAGLYITGLYSTVYNNKITNCGYMGSTPGGIYIGQYYGETREAPRGGYTIKYNTVRNSGRSCLAVQTSEQTLSGGNNGKESPFIPMEIAYNSFSNGGLCAKDTGIVYFWGATMGEENGKFSRVHHNAVFQDVPPAEALHSMIYHDNWIDGMETYDNIIFKTVNTTLNVREVFVQTASGSEATVTTNHSPTNGTHKAVTYRQNGLSGMSASDYPDGIVYCVGTKN